MTAVATAAPAAPPSASASTSVARGHGHRLLEAIEAFERFPALEYSRDRLVDLLAAEAVTEEIVAAVESDAALVIAVLRAANVGRTTTKRAICGVPDAVTALSAHQLELVAAEIPVFDFFGGGGAWSTAAHQFRLHAVATLRAVEALIRAGHAGKHDELRVAAQLHDIGKLVLLHAYGRYTTGSEGRPADRLAAERREWGMDHAVVGGVLARRIGLPNRTATLIERHHSDDTDPDVRALRLAELLAHYSVGHPVGRNELVSVARECGLVADALDGVLYELPAEPVGSRRLTPSPLSPRQTTIVRLLGKGLLYKQIARELGVSDSTVRTHTHQAYTKLKVPDRAQAVLCATARGWI
ncbi:MAG TPA: HDOD domain-containing protein [Thermoleophilaceae bacterium]|jgi:putative nucleotidyltransferase with HDIG domain